MILPPKLARPSCGQPIHLPRPLQQQRLGTGLQGSSSSKDIVYQENGWFFHLRVLDPQIALDWFFGGALTGAAMSPGRWLGPAIASGFFDNWYVYWIGPLVGGVLAALAYEYVFMPAKNR